MSTMNLHGEVISWAVKNGHNVPYADLKAALTAAGFDEKIARELAPKSAFARACSQLSDARIIRKLADEGEEIQFQFTKEEQDTGIRLGSDEKRFRYDYEATLTLNKVTGAVSCPHNPDLGREATRLIRYWSELRTPPDITRILNKLFGERADLFPVRDQGGVYFVPIRFAPFLAQVETFLAALGGSLRRFPVPAGYSDAGDRSVKESVDAGMSAIIEDHLNAIKEFSATTRTGTLEGMVAKINQTRFKIEAYAEYLTDKSDELKGKLADARAALRLKVSELGKGAEVKEEATVPA